MKKTATKPISSNLNTVVHEYQVSDGLKKAPKPEPDRTVQYGRDSMLHGDAPAVEASKGMIDAALKIARQRRETLDKIRNAFARNDEAEVLRLARELCGIKEDEEMHRTDSRIH